jgi:hypothetical protein
MVSLMKLAILLIWIKMQTEMLTFSFWPAVATPWICFRGFLFLALSRLIDDAHINAHVSPSIASESKYL